MQCLQHPYFQCHFMLYLYEIRPCQSLKSTYSTHPATNKNQDTFDLNKNRNYNSNLSNFINVKKNVLPKLDVISGRTSTINLNSTQNKTSSDNIEKNSVEKFTSNSSINLNSLNINKANKTKIEDFMLNFFKN